VTSWTSTRFRKLSAAAASSRSTTTSALPSMPRPASAALAALVLGVSKPHESTTMILPSLARSDSAERSARPIIFFGVFWSYLRGFGPRATPPPL